MTNSEAIKSMRNLDDLISITESEHESVKTAIFALEHNSTLIEYISNLQNENTDFFNKLVESERENDKLKAEIERLSKVINALAKASEKQNDENEQLKSKLEQSVGLPCKVGDIVYAYSTYFGILAYEINSIHICCGISFEAIASRNDDMLDSFDFDIEDIGKTIFLTREEVEQSLKGQVQE